MANASGVRSLSPAVFLACRAHFLGVDPISILALRSGHEKFGIIWPEEEQTYLRLQRMQHIPDVFEIPEPIHAPPISLLTVLATKAIAIGAMLALVVPHRPPGGTPQITYGR